VIDLSPEALNVTGPYRVGIEFQHDATPSLAVDDDGVTAARNFVNLSGTGWEETSAPGDFVLRTTLNVPEPNPLLMLAAGATLLVVVARRRSLTASRRGALATLPRNSPYGLVVGPNGESRGGELPPR
jgi:hypothetical protein